MAQARVRVTRRHLNEQVAAIIRQRIISLEFPPGERLIVDTLASEINVSMTPVREGLKELVSEGLVSYNGKSYSVFNPSRAEIEDIFRIRTALEQLAVVQAAGSMSADEVGELREDYLQSSGGGTPSIDAQIASDRLIHDAICRYSRNERLQSLVKPLQEQTWLVKRWLYTKTDTGELMGVINDEHLTILERMAAQDGPGAEEVLKRHLVTGQEAIMKLFRDGNLLQ